MSIREAMSKLVEDVICEYGDFAIRAYLNDRGFSVSENREENYALFENDFETFFGRELS